ncbi:arsenate reductase family protein [Halarcobacter mediterraneus]|uniref:Arsenate reductase family protein n=2 Tax=Halarcobacter mediterraneus TaxID=2023153 RepID=A0A4Q1AVI4_9BACT|nr:arsenate reductase family protein [Halarcobacter mediterraneus]
MMKVYGISNCASVKKAKKFFDEHSILYEFVDLSKTSLDKEKIESWQNFLPAGQMLNSRSKSYREMDLKNKKLDDKKALKAILKDNLILKRPIIEHGLNGEQKFTIGFDEQEYKQTFL